MISARLATADDSDDVYEWRNDTHTRKMSHTTDAVALTDHKRWFERSLSCDKRMLIMCESNVDITKVAVVRFDIDAHSALVSINMAPEMRAKGLAKDCLQSAIRLFTSLQRQITYINAEIKTVNTASTRTFERVGFTQIKQKNDVFTYQFLV